MTQISFTRNTPSCAHLLCSLFCSSIAAPPKAVVVLTTSVALSASMPLSALQRTKRAFVTMLLSVASTYSVAVKVNRNSDDEELLGAYRQVVKKAHPDKGGSKEDFQTLQSTHLVS